MIEAINSLVIELQINKIKRKALGFNVIMLNMLVS